MSDVTVTDNREASRYEARLGDELAGFADYQLTDGQVVFPHTEVDPAYEGKGVGSALARHALEAARQDGTRTVVPTCSFIRAWIDKHPEYADLVQGAAPRKG
ncbi:GNAT family N-acetyltransferase [Mariniluteicoccus flavus]